MIVQPPDSVSRHPEIRHHEAISRMTLFTGRDQLVPVLGPVRTSSLRRSRRRPASGESREKTATTSTSSDPDRSHQGRRTQAVAGDGDDELLDRRDRAPAHRFAQHEARERVDARQAGRVGAGQRTSRSVGTIRPRLDAQAILGAGDRAPVHSLDRLSQGVVSRHRGHARSAGGLFRRQDRGRLRQIQRQAEGRDRA